MKKTSYPEATCCSDSQDHPLLKAKVHFSAHMSPPLIAILCHINPIRNYPPYLFKINSNIIFLSTSKSFKWSLSFRFFDKNSVRISYLTHA